MQITEVSKKLICFITCAVIFFCSFVCVKTDVFAANISSKSSESVISEKLYFTYNDITDWYGPTKSINILNDISYLVELDKIVSVDVDVIIPELLNVYWNYNGKDYTSGIYISLDGFKVNTAWGLTSLHSSINVDDLIANNVVKSSFAELTNLDIVVFDINPEEPSVVDGLEVLYYFTINYVDDDSNSSGSYDDISDSTSYIFYGDALYQLLSTGIWSCGYIVDGVNYPAQPASMSYDSDNYGVVMSFTLEHSSMPGSLSKSNLILSFDTDYDNVISIESSVASTLTYKDTFTNTLTFTYAKNAYMGAVDKNGILNYGVSFGIGNDVLSLKKVSYYDFDGSNRYLRENIPLLPLIINNNTLKNASIGSISYHVTHNLENMGSVYFVCNSICIKELEFKVEGVMSTKLNALLSTLEDTNIKIDKVADKVDGLTYIIGEPTEEDISAVDEIEQGMQDAKDKADEFKDAMDDVETPEVDEVLPDDSVDQILQDENIVDGQPYIFSILESLQSITWLLLMILISVTVGVIRYIIYGKT